MDIRAATLTDISEISILLTQLTQEFIAPTCTAEGARRGENRDIPMQLTL